MPSKPTVIKEYNPLDYENLTKNCVEELMRRGPYSLKFDEPFEGAGVYALFYVGSLPEYEPIKSTDATWPIYVGKAVPPGARKGGKKKGGQQTSRALVHRLREHRDSIEAARNLSPDDFLCRFLVVTPLWITMAERFLIENFQPVWNVCIEGFGNHDPGKKRMDTAKSLWDIFHPGRDWAKDLPPTRTAADTKVLLREYLKTHHPGAKLPPLTADADLYMEDEEEDASED
jgi:hypothetical protein